MGFINKDTLTIDAILTNKGRDYLRKAVFGENQNGEHVITKFAFHCLIILNKEMDIN